MLEKVKKALAGPGVFLPGSVKALVLEMAAEIDQLRADVEKVKNQPKEF